MKKQADKGNFNRANLIEADLREVNLEGADLREANFEGANLRGCPTITISNKLIPSFSILRS